MPHKKPPVDCTRWIVFRLGHLGDVILTTGVLEYLGRTYGWEFVFITREAFADVLRNHPHISRVLTLRQDQLDARALLALRNDMTGEFKGWGLLDLHGTLRSRLFSLGWPGPILRSPKMAVARRLFLASRGRLFGEALRAHNVPQRYFMAVSAPPPEAAALAPHIYLSDDELRGARRRLGALFAPDTHPVALHPYATHALKVWPARHWRTLTARLDAAGIPWLVLGRGASLFPGDRRDLSNSTSLRESCAIIAQCRSLVTGDSGPMHLASAAGTSVLALFGPTTREWGFYPEGPRDRVLETSLPCRPCSLHGGLACPRAGECLASITPEEVLRALEAVTP